MNHDDQLVQQLAMQELITELAPVMPVEEKAQRNHYNKQIKKMVIPVKEGISVRKKIEKLSEQLIGQYTAEKIYISSPRDIFEIAKPLAAFAEFEELWVIALNRRNKVVNVSRIYTGSVSSSQVRIGELYRPAIIHNASAIVLFHNHPSGDATPSPDDVAVTRGIVQAGKLLDIECLDHLVVTPERYVSLKERGLGFS